MLALLVVGAAEANVAGDGMRHLLQHRYMEEGEVAQHVQSLNSMPPLVTAQSIQVAAPSCSPILFTALPYPSFLN